MQAVRVFGVSIKAEDASAQIRRQKRIARFALATALASILVFLFTFVAFTPPSPYRRLLFACLLAWVGLVVGWLALFFEARSCDYLGNVWRRLLPLPVVGVLMIGLALTHVPLHLAFLVNRGAMDSAARDVMSGKRDPSKIRWIGLYPVSDAYGDRHSFWFNVKGTADCADFCFDSGFSYGKEENAEISPAGGRLGKHWSFFWSYDQSGALSEHDTVSHSSG